MTDDPNNVPLRSFVERIFDEREKAALEREKVLAARIEAFDLVIDRIRSLEQSNAASVGRHSAVVIIAALAFLLSVAELVVRLAR